MNKKTVTQLQQSVLSAINEGRVTMRSKKYFLAQTIVYSTALVIVVIALVYLISFVFFVLHIRGAWELVGFGFPGLIRFFLSVPWVLAGIGMIFFIILEVLLNKKPIAYRQPIVITVVGLIVLSIGIGYVFAQLPLHRAVYDLSVEGEGVPLVGGIYREFGERPLHDAYLGIITGKHDTGFFMETKEHGLIEVMLLESTRIHPSVVLEVGVPVMVMGDLEAEVLEAFGVRTIEKPRQYPRFNQVPTSGHNRSIQK